MNSSGLSVVYKLNLSECDLQRIIDESSVVLRTGDVLTCEYLKDAGGTDDLSTSNETESTVLKEACYTRASLPPPPLTTPPLTQCG